MIISKEKIIQGLWLVMVVSFFVFSWKILQSDNLSSFVKVLGVWGPLAIIIAKISTLVIAPLGGAPVYLISAALYGTLNGFIFCFIGDAIGSFICFMISRHYGVKILGLFMGQSSTETVIKIASLLNNTKTLIKARIAFITLHELFSYAAGLSNISKTRFMLIHSIFLLPPSLALAFLGSHITLFSKNYPVLSLGVIFFVSFIGIFSFYKDYQKSQGM